MALIGKEILSFEYNLHSIIFFRFSEVVVSKNVRHPFDMVVFMDKVFWSDWSNQAIMTSSLNDHVSDVIHNVIYHPFGVTVNHPAYHDGSK